MTQTQEKLFDETVGLLRASIASVKGSIEARQLGNDFRQLVGYEVPYRKLGFRTLVEFLQAVPTLMVVPRGNQVFVEACKDERSSSVVNLINKQKTTTSKKSKSLPFKRTNSYSINVQRVQPDRWRPVNVRFSKQPPPVPRPATKFPHNQFHVRSSPAAKSGRGQLERELTARFEMMAMHFQNNNNNNNNYAKQKVLQLPPPPPTLKKLPQQAPKMDSSKISNISSVANMVNSDKVADGVVSSERTNRAALMAGVPLITKKRPTSPPPPPTVINASAGVGVAPPLPSNRNNRSNGQVSRKIDAGIVGIEGSKNVGGAGGDRNVRREFEIVKEKGSGGGRKVVERESAVAVGAAGDVFAESGEPIGDLAAFAAFWNLDEPEYTVLQRQTKRCLVYYCKIRVEDNTNSSYPQDSLTESDARICAAKVTLERLKEKYGTVRNANVLTSTEKDVLERIPPMVCMHYNGIWSWQVQADYKDRYGEVLPDNWLSVVAQSPMISVECFGTNKKYVLRFVHPSEDKTTATTRARRKLSCEVSIPSSVAQFNELGVLQAEITCAVAVQEIWCRQLDHDDVQNFYAMLDRMEAFYNNNYSEGGTLRAAKVSKGSFYAVWDGTWNRARVLEVANGGGGEGEGEEVSCFLVDRGMEVTVAKEDVYELMSEFARLPSQAFVCRLVGLEELQEASQGSKYISGLMQMNVTVESAVEGDDNDDTPILPVIMYDPETGASINKKLMDDLALDYAKVILEPKSAHTVRISYVLPNGDFCVQKSCTVAFRKLQELLDDLRQSLRDPATSSAKVHEMQLTRDALLNRDRLYLADLDGDGYKRVRLRDASPNFDYGQFLFVDDGNACVVPIAGTRLYPLDKLSSLLSRYPEQALEVRLANVNGNAVPGAKIADALKALAAKDEDVLMMVEEAVVTADDGVPNVRLFVRTPTLGLECVNEQIKKSQENSNNSEKLMDKIKDKIAPSTAMGVPSTGSLANPVLPKVGNYFDVRIPFAVNPWNFMVQPNDSVAELNELMRQLDGHFNETESGRRCVLDVADVLPGNIYATKFTDGKWYRVSVIKVIHAGSISVCYCDFGYYASVKLQELRVLDDKKFLQLPAQAIKAKLNGIKPKLEKWTVEDCKYFQGLVTRKAFVSVLLTIEKDELYTCDKILGLKLIDTSDPDVDVVVGDILVKNNIAVNC